MKRFDVQYVELEASREHALDYLADPRKLPEWTQAFASASAERARLRTPQGEVEVDLETRVSRAQGTVDWYLTFPDGSRAQAFSRVVEVGPRACAYTFVLIAPPVPLEQIEGTLEQQSRTLAGELDALRSRLNATA